MPQDWIHYSGNSRHRDSFLRQHQQQLEELLNGRETGAHARVSEQLDCLDAFQRLMEKQSHEELPLITSDNDPIEKLRELGHEMVMQTMKFWRGQMMGKGRPEATDATYAKWFDPYIEFPERTHGKCLNGALRRAWDLGWRRSYFLFAARALTPQGGPGLNELWWAQMPKLGYGSRPRH